MNAKASWCKIASLLVIAAGGCHRHSQGNEGGPPAKGAPLVVSSSPSGAGHRATVRQLFVTTAQGETICSETALGEFRDGGVVERETYSFPKLNQRLTNNPELAAVIGMTRIDDCEDARLFTRRFIEYQRSHPQFDDEGPTKAEQFNELLGDPTNVARP